jgi:hypothetical protein
MPPHQWMLPLQQRSLRPRRPFLRSLLPMELTGSGPAAGAAPAPAPGHGAAAAAGRGSGGLAPAPALAPGLALGGRGPYCRLAQHLPTALHSTLLSVSCWPSWQAQRTAPTQGSPLLSPPPSALAGAGTMTVMATAALVPSPPTIARPRVSRPGALATGSAPAASTTTLPAATAASSVVSGGLPLPG